MLLAVASSSKPPMMYRHPPDGELRPYPCFPDQEGATYIYDATYVPPPDSGDDYEHKSDTPQILINAVVVMGTICTISLAVGFVQNIWTVLLAVFGYSYWDRHLRNKQSADNTVPRRKPSVASTKPTKTQRQAEQHDHPRVSSVNGQGQTSIGGGADREASDVTSDNLLLIIAIVVATIVV